MAKKSRKRTARRSARRTARRSARRSGGGSLMKQIQNSFNKENLYLAGGVVLSNVATNYLLRQEFARKLPGMDGASAATAKTVYSTLIPVLAAAATYRYNRSLAQGMVVGALSNAVIGLVNQNAASLPPQIAANVAPPALTSGVGGLRGVRGLRALPIALAGKSGTGAYPNGRVGGLKNVYASPTPFNRDAFAKS